MKQPLLSLGILIMLLSTHAAFASPDAGDISFQINELRHRYYEKNQKPPEEKLRDLLAHIIETESAEERAGLTARWGTLASETEYPEVELTAIHASHISDLILKQDRSILLSSADFSLAMYYKTEKANFLSQAKTFTRKALLIDASDTEALIRLGIQESIIVLLAKNMNQIMAAESALRKMNEKNISEIDDPFLKYNALISKSKLFLKLLNPGNSDKCLERACLIFPDNHRAAPLNNRPGIDIHIPYYADFGLKTETEDDVLLAPLAGIGMRKSAFSSSIMINAGMKYFSNNLSLNLGYRQAVIPDFSCFDFSLLESYAAADTALSLNGNTLRAGITGGWLLTSRDSENFLNLKSTAFMAFGLREVISLELLAVSYTHLRAHET